MKTFFFFCFLLPIASSWYLQDEVRNSLINMFLAETKGKILTDNELLKLRNLYSSAADIVLNGSLTNQEMDEKMLQLVYDSQPDSKVAPRAILSKRKDYLVEKLKEIGTNARYYGIDGKEFVKNGSTYGFSRNFTVDTEKQRAERISWLMFYTPLCPGGERMRESWNVAIQCLFEEFPKESSPGVYAADSFQLTSDGMRISALAGLTDNEKIDKMVARIQEKQLWNDVWNSGYDKKEFARRFIRTHSKQKIFLNIPDDEFDKMTHMEKVRMVRKIELAE